MPYTTGTATVAANGTAVTGQSTSWASTVRAGDYFWCKGNPVRIASVNSNTSLTLAFPWPGTAQTAQPYEIQQTPDAVRISDATLQIIDLLNSGNLSSEAALVGAADRISYYTGAGQKALTVFGSIGRGVAGATTANGALVAIGLSSTGKDLALAADLSSAYVALGFGAGTASVTLPKGTKAAPGITFQNDTNTGFATEAADVISVMCAGTEIANFRETSIGIGRAPGSTVDGVQGISIFSGGRIVLDRGSFSFPLMMNQTTAGGQIAFYVGQTQVGAINSTASATSYVTTSDETFKTFHGLYDGAAALAMIRKDPVRRFTWDAEHGGGDAVGWGAQTSFALSPDLATEGGWRHPETGEPARKGQTWRVFADDRKSYSSAAAFKVELGDDGETERKVRRPVVTLDAVYQPWGVDQGKRTPYAWAAIAHLADRIDALERAAA